MNNKLVDIGGLKINALTKAEALRVLKERAMDGKRTIVTTLYSEFLYTSLRSKSAQELLNRADLAVADGITIPWAAKYLSLSFSFGNYYLKILQAFWQALYSLAAIIFKPGWVKSIVPEKIVGAELVWDLAELAVRQNLSVYLLGGFGDTTKRAAEKLKTKYPSLNIAGWSNKDADDPTIIDDITKTQPDILLVAFGPLRQERWITEHWENLPCSLAIGLGGTFDYLAGKRLNPPKFLRSMGLEWLFRLFTQPHRIKRIFRSTMGLVILLIRYKVFTSYPMRNSAVAIILNRENRVFVGRKLNSKIDIISNQSPEQWENYWQFPQGGIDPHEDAVAASKREAEEETGLQGLRLIKTSKQTNAYIWNNALRSLWHNRNYLFRGQTQKVVYFKFDGPNNAIKLPEQEEFVEYKWVDIESLDKIIHKEKVRLAKIAQQDLLENGLEIR